ncbi:MAG: hypothetical protein V3U87_05110 [Methylococcaceae bacterium]
MAYDIRTYADQFDFAASVDSDFHTPDNKWVELGCLVPLPDSTKPVWELF